MEWVIDGTKKAYLRGMPDGIDPKELPARLQPGDSVQLRCRVYLPYGSFFYNESRDADYAAMEYRTFHYSDGLLLALKRMTFNPGDQADVVDPCQDTLAAACLAKEYPGLVQVRESDLSLAIRINTEARVAMFEYFPSDYTARKALFAYYQKVAWEEEDHYFVDRKSEVLERVPQHLREPARRLLYHDNWANADVRAVYLGLFGREPEPVKVRIVPGKFRDIRYVIERHDGIVCELEPGSNTWNPGEVYNVRKGLERVPITEIVVCGLGVPLIDWAPDEPKWRKVVLRRIRRTMRERFAGLRPGRWPRSF